MLFLSVYLTTILFSIFLSSCLLLSFLHFDLFLNSFISAIILPFPLSIFPLFSSLLSSSRHSCSFLVPYHLSFSHYLFSPPFLSPLFSSSIFLYSSLPFPPLPIFHSFFLLPFQHLSLLSCHSLPSAPLLLFLFFSSPPPFLLLFPTYLPFSSFPCLSPNLPTSCSPSPSCLSAMVTTGLGGAGQRVWHPCSSQPPLHSPPLPPFSTLPSAYPPTTLTLNLHPPPIFHTSLPPIPHTHKNFHPHPHP